MLTSQDGWGPPVFMHARHLAGCPAHLECGPGDGGAHTETGPLGTSRLSLPQVCDFLSLDHSSWFWWVAVWNKQEYRKASKTIPFAASSFSWLALPRSLSSTTMGWILVRTDHWSSTPSATWASWADTPHPSLNQKRAPVCLSPPPFLPHCRLPPSAIEAVAAPSFPLCSRALSRLISQQPIIIPFPPFPFTHFLLPAKKSRWRSLSVRVPFSLFCINAPLRWPTAESFTCNVI